MIDVNCGRFCSHLHFRQHRNDRGHHAEQHVEADEELVDVAAARGGVEDEEEHDGDERQHVVEDGDAEQRWTKKEAGEESTAESLKVREPPRDPGSLTCVPAPRVPRLHLVHPRLVPRVGEVHQQHQLDQDEGESPARAHHEPRCDTRTHTHTQVSY